MTGLKSVLLREEGEEQKTKLLHRLKRLEGQVRGLQNMIEDERDCQEILMLLSGIRSALDATGDVILATYLEKCQTDLKKGKANVGSIMEAVRLARG
jgi:CsoR family transcriptional regulator, copper-sensing transcriptional repressor